MLGSTDFIPDPDEVQDTVERGRPVTRLIGSLGGRYAELTLIGSLAYFKDEDGDIRPVYDQGRIQELQRLAGTHREKAGSWSPGTSQAA